MSLHFTIPGEPVSWKRAGRQGVRRSFNPKAMAEAQESIRQWADVYLREHRLKGSYPAGGRFYVGLRFLLGSEQTRDRDRDCDLDNLIKNVLDALRGVIWHDDMQVAGFLPGTAKFSGCKNPQTIAAIWHESEMPEHAAHELYIGPQP